MSRMSGQKVPYTVTTGPSANSKRDPSGNVLGTYTKGEPLNRKKSHGNNGSQGKAYNKSL